MKITGKLSLLFVALMVVYLGGVALIYNWLVSAGILWETEFIAGNVYDVAPSPLPVLLIWGLVCAAVFFLIWKKWKDWFLQ